MSNILKLFLFVTIVQGCNSKTEDNCLSDEEFGQQFFNCIQIVGSTIERSEDSIKMDEIATSDVLRSIKCLEAITKHKANIRFEEVGFAVYESVETFEEDKKEWEKWYKKNKCGYTMDSAEYFFKRNRVRLPDYTSPKVMDSLKKYWPGFTDNSIKTEDSLSHVSIDTYWPKLILKKN